MLEATEALLHGREPNLGGISEAGGLMGLFLSGGNPGWLLVGAPDEVW